MKRILLAGLAVAALGLATAPASAQWGPPGGGYGGSYGGGGGYGRGGYGRGYRDLEDDDEDERPRYRRGPAYGQGYGRPRMGSICITSRGNCAVGGLAPSGSPCGCNVPGFGPKRGAVN